MKSAELQLNFEGLAGINQSVVPRPVSGQLLKWIGSKQRQAESIMAAFPTDFETYIEPFLGGGGILGKLAPSRAIAGDVFGPLIEIWRMLNADKDSLKAEYAKRHALIGELGKKTAYESVKADYNHRANGMDLLFLCRSCYGGVVRFRKSDGFMSTPVGIHNPMPPDNFAKRVDEWHEIAKHVEFVCADFDVTMARARRGDLIYCDPPYVDSQAILYGAQTFSLPRLFDAIAACKVRGAKVALSIDGTKYSGKKLCDVPIPPWLFEREIFIDVGRSMLKRFQMDGQSLEDHHVKDRLLLTY